MLLRETFCGPSNAGLRRAIRKRIARGGGSGPTAAALVRGLLHSVALTGPGAAKLKAIAAALEQGEEVI